MISCMTMIFTLHFTLNNFCEPQKYEHFLSKMFFKAYYRIILRKFGRKFLSLNKSSQKEKYFFHLCCNEMQTGLATPSQCCQALI